MSRGHVVEACRRHPREVSLLLGGARVLVVLLWAGLLASGALLVGTLAAEALGR